jgi:hypothetical protein
MSEVKTDKLTGTSTAGSISVVGEGNSTTTNLQQGLAKAWAKYNQTTPAVNDSLNIASVADNSAGNFTPTFTNAMASANYAFPAISGEKHIQQTGTDAAGSFSLLSSSAGNSAGDGIDYFTVHGDLA